MPNAEVWFEADWYAQQKTAQMNVIKFNPEWLEANGNGATEWTAALYNQYIDTTPYSPWDNFLVCNAAEYNADQIASGELTTEDINVSPNKYFDIPTYLQGLANLNNANPDIYGAPEGGGQWTMQLEMDEIFNKYKSSVWNHYDQKWHEMLDVNPSNAFNTRAYIQMRADAAEVSFDEMVQSIRNHAQYNNPVKDFYAHRDELGITEPPAVEAGAEVNPGSNTWTPWGEGGAVGPVTPDPFDLNFVEDPIIAGKTGPYEGKDGQNTHFTAAWSGSGAAASTLGAADTITGGKDALNSLVVDLDNNWNGFSGTGDDPFNPQPNVTNVQRIVLNHNAGHAETNWIFDAKNISGETVRYDLNATGAGTISLKGLNDAVNEINISNLKAPNVDQNTSFTNLEWQIGANSGKDEMTIGLNEVGSGNIANQITGLEDIETININAKGGSNNVDITSATDAVAVNIKGAGTLRVVSDAASVKTYDAHEATGAINFQLSNVSKQTIIGGSAKDTVTLNTGGSVKAADWSGIEYLTFANNSDVTVNAKGLAGLEQVWIGNSAANTIKNLDAQNLTVYQTAAAAGGTKATTINGGNLGNLGWISSGDPDDGTNMKANLVSNATGNVTIELTGEDTLADKSVFDVAKATGTVKITAPNAGTYNVGDGVEIKADNATALDLNIVGGFTIENDATKTNLNKVQNVNITLENDSDNANAPDSFIYAGELEAARQIMVNAGGENVLLGNIGDATANGVSVGFEMQIKDAFNAVVGDMASTKGGNVTAQIGAEGYVGIGNIDTSTNTTVNGEGDVRLTVIAEEGIVGVDSSGLSDGKLDSVDIKAVEIKGGALMINFSQAGVATGTSIGQTAGDSVGATGKAVGLDAQEYIRYQGAEGADYIEVKGVGKGSNSQLFLGEGKDNLKIDDLALGAGKTATINIDLGDGDGSKDTVDLTPQTTGNLLVRIQNVESTDEVNGTAQAWSSGMDDANIAAVLKSVGLESLASQNWSSGVYKASDDLSYYLVKSVAGSGTDGVTVLAVQGDDLFASGSWNLTT